MAFAATGLLKVVVGPATRCASNGIEMITARGAGASGMATLSGGIAFRRAGAAVRMRRFVSQTAAGSSTYIPSQGGPREWIKCV
jgi:hypothetical protein